MTEPSKEIETDCIPKGVQTDITKPEYDFSKLGLRDDIPEHIYHRSPGISKHALDEVAESPLLYKTKKDHPEPSTPAMRIGSATHAYVLETDRFTDEFAIEPAGAPKKPTSAQLNAPKPTEKALISINYWKKWNDENAGKFVISNKPGDDPFWKPGEWQTIQNIHDAVRAHPIASILLDPSQGWAERSAYWMDREFSRLCRCRVDFFNEAHGLAIDFKTAESAGYSDFIRAVSQYRYHVQAESYTAGLKACGVPVKAFVFVVVEKKPPYQIGIYTLDAKARHIGHAMWRQAMRTFDECKKTDEWPAFPPEVRELELPPWCEKGKYY